MAFSPDGRTLATNVSFGGVMLWDVATHKRRAFLSKDTYDPNYVDVIDQVAFSPNGRLIAGYDRKDRTVFLWKTPK